MFLCNSFARFYAGLLLTISLTNCTNQPIVQPADNVSPEPAETILPGYEDCFFLVEQQPEFPGGFDAMKLFIGQNLRYPQNVGCVSGRVFASFLVEADGRLTNIEVVRSLSPACDEEAVRVIQAMPRWKPGKQSGRPVQVKYNLPISFALE